MYLVFTRMPGESYSRRLMSLLLYLCYVFRALINSLVCWSFSSTCFDACTKNRNTYNKRAYGRKELSSRLLWALAHLDRPSKQQYNECSTSLL